MTTGGIRAALSHAQALKVVVWILLLALSGIAVALIVSVEPAEADTNSSTWVCNRAYNRADPEKSEFYASTAERYPNEAGVRCKEVMVAIWDYGMAGPNTCVGSNRRAFGREYDGHVGRYWYKDFALVHSPCSAHSATETWPYPGSATWWRGLWFLEDGFPIN